MGSQDQMTVFTNKMLSDKVFNCADCDNLLTTPVMLVQNVGNVCSECFGKYQNETSLPNAGLETILSQLKLPCKFNKTGCNERIIFKDIKSHEINCKYFERCCLLAYNGCEWKGIQSAFLNHFVDIHSEDVLTNPFNIYTFDINIEKPVNITKLLKGRKDCVVKIWSNNTNSLLMHAIYDLKSNDCDYEFCIKHMGTNGSSVETVCKVFPLNTLNEPIKIDLNALKQMINVTDFVTIKLKFANNSELAELDEKMLQYFECPVCKSLMRPPIYQCKFGHSFCNNCKPRLEKCPNCRALFGPTRNYSLEGLTVGIPYACMYHHLGCEVTLSANDSNKHEATCSYKPYPCPLDNCSFRGTHSNIGRHLDELHKDKVISSDFYKTTVEFHLMEQMNDYYNYCQKFYMVFDENIFRLSFKRNSDYSFWAVEVLRKRNEEDVFIYDVGIIDMRKPDRRLIRCDLCFTDVSTDDLFKKCILFPNNILASYANNANFTFYCQIRKRQ